MSHLIIKKNINAEAKTRPLGCWGNAIKLRGTKKGASP